MTLRSAQRNDKEVVGLLILGQKDANVPSLVTDKNIWIYTYTALIRHYVVATTSCLSSVCWRLLHSTDIS